MMATKAVCLLALLAASAAALPAATTDADSLWAEWKQRHGKTYAAVSEEALRQQVFSQNLARIARHNAENANSGYQMAVNEFADLTPDEFRRQYLGYNPTLRGISGASDGRVPFTHANVTPPAAVDWVKAGAVTGVKNQLYCGSCWAYSTTGSIEGINYLKTGELVPLSEQQLVDCDTKKDMGCNGGLMDYAFAYTIKNGGLDTEEDYSYWSWDEPCNRLREGRKVVTIDGYADVPPNDERSLAKAVAAQPVSVAICASQLQFYSSGVVSDCCEELDHGVLVVGYAEEAGKPFWTVKNSWGPTWGEKGFFRLAKDTAKPGGTCNVAKLPSYPIKTGPNPAHPPQVCGWLGRSECAAGSACDCLTSLLGLVCLQWGCAEAGPPGGSHAAAVQAVS